jgi:hypothetical protein
MGCIVAIQLGQEDQKSEEDRPFASLGTENKRELLEGPHER